MAKIEETISKIPELPKLVYKLQEIKKNDLLEIDEIINVLREDHFLVSKVMRVVNSKLFRHYDFVETLHSAVSLYGVNFILSIAIVEAINNTIFPDLELYPVSAKRFLELNEYSCKLMMLWLNKNQIEMIEKLIIPSLLQSFGTYLVSKSVEIGKENKFLIKIKTEHKKRVEIEKEFTGFTSNELTTKIFEKWNLEKDLIKLIKDVDNPNSKETLILNILRKIFNPISPFDKDEIDESIKLATKYNLDADSLKKALQELIALTKL